MPVCNKCNKTVKKLEYHQLADKYSDKIKELMESGYSILYLSKNSETIFGEKISYDILSTTCRHYGIKIPNLKDTANSKITRSLYKSTVESIYGPGIINVSQSNEVKEKKNNTNLDRYGVINPFQRSEIKEKSKNTLFENYGVYHPVELPAFKNARGRLSTPHKKVSKFLESIGIQHENDAPGNFRKFNTELNRIYSPIPDIYMNDRKVVIEIFGDRWHMNPTMFFETDIVNFFDGPHTAKEVWEGDRIRNSHIESFGVDLYVIWEYNIKNNFDDVKQQILEIINNPRKP